MPQASAIADPTLDTLFPPPSSDFSSLTFHHAASPLPSTSALSSTPSSLRSNSQPAPSHSSPAPTTSPLSSTCASTSSPLLRKSTRATGPPTWLKDFVCPPPAPRRSIATNPTPASSATSSSPSHSFTSYTNSVSTYPLLHPSDFTHLLSNYVISLAVLQVPEPSTFSQAQQYPEWNQAMAQELTALE